MLQRWNVVRKYSHICSFRNIPLSARVFLILPMPTFFCKNSVFSGKNSTFAQTNSVEAVLDIFWFWFHFWKIKVCCYWKSKFYKQCVQNLALRLLQIGHKLKNNNDLLKWCFDVFFFIFSSLVTGQSLMSISSLVLGLRQFFDKGLTLNPKRGITRVWVLPVIWILWRNLTQTCLMKFYWVLQNAKGYSFYCF